MTSDQSTTLMNYHYAGNRPILLTDPYGTQAQQPVDDDIINLGDSAVQRMLREIRDFAIRESCKRFGRKGCRKNNGPADAWRHCVASCIGANEVGQKIIEVAGIINEIRRGNTIQEARMDLRNNAVGRRKARLFCPLTRRGGRILCKQKCNGSLKKKELYLLDPDP